MKRISISLLLLSAVLMTSCETVPVTVSYTGAAGGHQYTAGYSKAGGAVLVVNQK